PNWENGDGSAKATLHSDRQDTYFTLVVPAFYPEGALAISPNFFTLGRPTGHLRSWSSQIRWNRWPSQIFRLLSGRKENRHRAVGPTSRNGTSDRQNCSPIVCSIRL